MTTFFSNAGIKSTCKKLLLPIGLLSIFSSPMMASNRYTIQTSVLRHKTTFTITGTVTDDQHQPVPGVSVYDKKTKKSTVTDVNGKYSISLEESSTLVFSFMGLFMRQNSRR